MSVDRFGTVVIVGVGLIGGSIGQALRARKVAKRVVGLGRGRKRLDDAERLGAIDEGTVDPEHAYRRAEIAVICTPVDRIAGDAKLAARLGPDALLVTDAGSTKRLIVEDVEKDETGRACFVGAHPIAGSERSGVAFARADLFEGRVCAITPTSSTPSDRLERCRTFWSALGCRIVEMAPDDHDRVLALSSHLPHVVSSALAATVPVDAFPLAAGAYRDATRVAAADAGLWSAIFRVNRDPVIAAISDFEARLAKLREAIHDQDARAIEALWQEGRERRMQFRDDAAELQNGD
jgi:prephenate dehydrogenase